jgi:hypothetical protein
MRSLTKWSAALYRAAAKLQLISPAREEQGVAATNVAATPPKLRREEYPPGAQSPFPQVQIPGFMLITDKLWISAHPALR